MPEEIAVKSDDKWQEAEDARLGRKARTSNVRPTQEKTLSVL
jgi:hypothetical protein